MNKMSFSLALFILLLTAVTPSFAAIRYVNHNASGGMQDGMSWNSAFRTVQEGLNAAQAGDEIWVAQGTYIENIAMKNGVALYGGFQGIESARTERDWNTYITKLSANNVGRVILAEWCDNPMTRIDGFTISDGHFAYPSMDLGGGILSRNSTLTIENNVITDNVLIENGMWAGEGGGIGATNSVLTIRHNIIKNNSGAWGGGMRLENSTISVTHNMFTGNFGAGGGGMYIGNSTGSISYNRLESNDSGLGGGMFLASSNQLTVANNIIANGTAVAQYSGGAIYMDFSSPLIVNNTITGNTGFAVTVLRDCMPTLANNIVAFNSAGIYSDISSTPTLRNNNVYGNQSNDYVGLTPGSGDISADPILFNPADGNYRLGFGSPSMETASAADAPEDDFDGITRPQDGDDDGLAYPDMGAYEYVYYDADVDNDNYYDYQDCNDQNPDINPGVTEIRLDGVDQDCNGYDLTLEIITATYRPNKDKLTVDATSSLGAAANLVLDGFGPMTFSGNKWSIVIEPAGGNPGLVTVTGVEGSESATVR